MSAVTLTPAPARDVVRELLDDSPIAPDELDRLDREVEEDRQRALYLHAATLDAIHAVNIFAGEVALALEPEDPRGRVLLRVQDGLDELWHVSGGPEREENGLRELRDRLGAALDRIGHQGSPTFRARLADAFEAELERERLAA